MIHVISAPYHPASNGVAERALKTFKTGMRKMTEDSFKQRLARFLFGYLTAPQSTTGVSSAEILMNQKSRSVLDLMNILISNRVESAQDRQIASHDKQVQSKTLALEDTFYVHNYDQGPKWVKGVVTEKEGLHNFIVEIMLTGQLTKWKRHTDQLRK